ncbi:MAG: hypothetical protein ACO3UU_13790 [Minisyncoccia bacterium]
MQRNIKNYTDYLNDEYSEYTFDSSWPKLSDDETISQEITCNGKTFISYTTDSDGIYMINSLKIHFDALD